MSLKGVILVRVTLWTGWGCICSVCWGPLWPLLVAHTSILASAMVFAGDADLGRGHCSTGYVQLDDGFLCGWASPGGCVGGWIGVSCQWMCAGPSYWVFQVWPLAAPRSFLLPQATLHFSGSCYQIFNTKIGKRGMFIFITRVSRHSNFQTVYRRTRRKPSSSVQFENSNDVTPSVINMNIPRFSIF